MPASAWARPTTASVVRRCSAMMSASRSGIASKFMDLSSCCVCGIRKRIMWNRIGLVNTQTYIFEREESPTDSVGHYARGRCCGATARRSGGLVERPAGDDRGVDVGRQKGHRRKAVTDRAEAELTVALVEEFLDHLAAVAADHHHVVTGFRRGIGLDDDELTRLDPGAHGV